LSLKRKTIKGVAWSGAGNIASQILRMVTLVIMVRLLTPDDYGTYAILSLFVGFFSVFANMGISQAVIYLDNPSQRMLSSIFMLNLGVGLSLYGLLVLLAGPAATFFGNEAITSLLRIIGILFVIGAFNVVQEALLKKKLNFKAVVLRDLTSQAVGASVGVGMALAGYGVQSLVGAALSGAFAKTILLWVVSGWRPLFWFSISDIREILAYCFNLTGFSFINYFARNADNFIIGKFLGSGALGVYSVAYNLMLYPLTNVSGVITRVLFPALSAIKSDPVRLKKSYLKVIRYIALITFPMMLGLLVVAETFVAVAFGTRWASLAPLLQVLALVGMVQSIVTTNGVIYIALGTTGLMLKIGTVNAVVSVLSFVVGLPFGVIGVATAYALANLIMLYPNLYYSWRQINLDVGEGLWALRHFLVSAVVMALAVALLGTGLAETAWSELWILIGQIIGGLALYVFVLLAVTKLGVIDMVREIVPRRPRCVSR